MKSFIYQAPIKTRHYLDRCYPKELLKQELIRALIRDREDLLRHTFTSPALDEPRQQVLVTMFHPAFKGLRPLVGDNWDTLGGSHKTMYIHEK